MGLFDLFRKKEEERYTYCLEGTETVTCGETEEVMRCLEFMGSAACLYPIKETTEIDSDLTRRLLAYTDGMTEKHVEEMHAAVCELMTWLTKGGSSPLKVDGTLEILRGWPIGGVLMTMKGETINFPYGGIRYNTPEGNTHMRTAKKVDDKLFLQWEVNGAPDLISVSNWTINLSSASMAFKGIETRRQQIKDYGRVLVSQDMTASGQIAPLAP